MIINTNVSALGTLRQLSQANQGLGKAIERLSSGFRINSAADDAAGLGIANRLRADIRAMQQANRNAEQANSLLQVAEGAALSLQGIADRMKELASQAASDNVNADGRALIQAEFIQLQQEWTRIVTTTQFQGNVLLDGSMGQSFEATGLVTGAGTVHGAFVGLDAVTSLAVGAGVEGLHQDGFTITASGTAGDDTAAVTLTSASGASATASVTTGAANIAGAQTLNFSLDGASIQLVVADDAVWADFVTAVNDTGPGIEGYDAFTVGVTGTTTGEPTQFMVSVSGNQGTAGSVGADFVALSSLDMRLATVGLDVAALDTKGDAITAIGLIDDAIDSISATFGTIGAAMNRMEFAQANLSTAILNFQASESVIRDVDMAAEVTMMVKFQILQQAGTAVLAQANSAPQGVLRLLS